MCAHGQTVYFVFDSHAPPVHVPILSSRVAGEISLASPATPLIVSSLCAAAADVAVAVAADVAGSSIVSGS